MNADDDRLDPEDADFVGCIARIIRQGVVEKLLSGNDAGCFTTEQYAERYRKSACNSSFAAMAPLTPDLARMHLRSLPDLVREVRSGVWAAVEGTE